jgi:hypothetical protein
MIVKNFDTVFKEQKKINVSKEYIIKNVFDLSNIKNDIHYIKTIKIQPYSKTDEINKLIQNNFINITIGGQNFYERNNNELRCCIDNNDFIEYDIDFTSPIFFKYNLMKLTLSCYNFLYKIIIDGYCFENIKELVKDEIMYEYYHNDKYYFKDEDNIFVCRSMSGMCGYSSPIEQYPKWYKNDFTLFNKIENNKDNNILTIVNSCKNNIEEKIFINEDKRYILYFINNIFNNNELLSILASPKMIDELTGIKYEKILEDYNNYLIGGYHTKKLEICYIENKDNLYSLKFIIPRDGDLIYKIKIRNKLSKFYNVDDSINIKINSYEKNTNINELNDDIELDNLIKFEPYNPINFTITFNKYYIEYMYDLYLDIGYCNCNNPLRKEVLTTDMELKLE